MTVAYKATGTTAGTSFVSSLAAPLPAGFAAGDFAFVQWAWWDNGATPSTPPSGWTRIGSDNNERAWLGFRELQAGDSNPTLVLSGNSYMTGKVITFTGLKSPATLTNSARAYAQGGALAAAVASVDDNALELVFSWVPDNRSFSSTPGSSGGFTQAWNVTGSFSQINLIYKVLGVAGNYQGQTISVVGPTPQPNCGQYNTVFAPIPVRSGAGSGTAQGDMVAIAEVGPPTQPAHSSMNSQGNLTMPTPKVFKVRKKPQRELVWVHGYDGERIGVID